MKTPFRRFAQAAAEAVGSPAAFLLAFVGTILWAISGPRLHYSEAWQLIINTVTNVATFLIVFLIQNTQNRDSKVMQLKLDELIRAVQPARTELVQMEDLSDDALNALQEEFRNMRERAVAHLEKIEASIQKRRENRSRS